MQLKNVPPSDGFDNDLLQRVKCFLNQKGHMPLRSLEVTVDQGVVLVRGQVPTFYLRQVALACIKRVAGVTQVIDSLDVASGSGQRLTADDLGQEESASSMQRRCDVPDRARTAHDARHKHVRNHQLLSSATK